MAATMDGREVMPAAAPPKRADPRALRLKLLNLIRSFYLEALSRLPTTQLWSTHARGLLVAGHCYGPLSPADNIVINAIWYDTAFPLRPTADFRFGDVLEITPESMARMAHRSLEGLIACLLHVCPSLSRDDALWHLDLSRADLCQAIATASGSGSAALAPTKAAYVAAAEAAHHPLPSAMALFASSVLPKVEHDAGMLLGTNQVLSTPVLDRLSALLVPSPLPEDLCPPPPLVTPWTAAIIKCRIENALDSQETSRQLIETALCKYARQTGKHYELHFITGTNVLIHLKIYWHINILARPKDAASELPIYFFVEATNPKGKNGEFLEENILLCCPISPSRVGRCNTCTAQFMKIDHPIDEEHHGGLDYNNDEIEEEGWDYYDCPLHADFIFFDAERDSTTVCGIEKYFPEGSDLESCCILLK